MLNRLIYFLFKNLNMRQTIAKNTFWIFISQIGGRLVRAIIIIYAARLLGATDYGIFSYGLTLAAILAVFTDLGIDMATFKEASQRREESHKYYSTAFATKIILGFIGVVIVFMVGPTLSAIPEVTVILPFVAIIFFFDTLREFGIVLIRTRERMELEAAVNTATNVAIVLFGLFFITVSPTALLLSAGYALGVAVGAFMVLYIFREYILNIRKYFSRKVLFRLVKVGLPITLAATAGTLMTNVDIYLLGFWRTVEEIGFYSAAQRPVTVLYGVLNILSAAAFPALTRFAVLRREKFASIVEKVLHLSAILSLPIVIGGIITSSQIINLIYGADYAPAVFIFQIFLLMLFANFGTVTMTYALLAHNHQNSILKFSVAALVLNIILDILLIPKFGGPGSAIATVFNQILLAGLLWYKLRNITGQLFAPKIFKAVIAIVPMAVISTYLISINLNVFLNIIISGVVYSVMLFLLKEQIVEELKFLFQNARSKF